MERQTAPLPQGARADSGNAMIIALLVLFLLTSVGISYIAVTKGDKQIAGNQMTSAQAFSYAEAGLSEALLRMSDPSDATNYIGQPTGTVNPGWGKYIVNDPGNSGLDPQYNSTLTDGLDNDLDAATDEGSEHYPETGSKQVSLALLNKLDYPWVKIRYKVNAANQVLYFGDHDGNPTTPPRENTIAKGVPELVLTAAGRKGKGAKTVTVEAIKWPLPPVPGSVYAEGNMNFNGNSFYIDGHDHNPTAPYDTIAGATSLPGIASPSNAGQITGALSNQQLDNVEGSGGDPSVQTSPVNLDLPAIAAGWAQLADLTYPANTTNPDMSGWGTMGSPSDLKVVHVTGDLSIQANGSGAGVLVVDGDFHLGGTVNYNGIIIVLGNVDIQGGGNAKNIVGGLMVQGTVTGTTNVAGNVKLMYSSAMINQLYALTKYEISSWIDQ